MTYTTDIYYITDTPQIYYITDTTDILHDKYKIQQIYYITPDILHKQIQQIWFITDTMPTPCIGLMINVPSFFGIDMYMYVTLL